MKRAKLQAIAMRRSDDWRGAYNEVVYSRPGGAIELASARLGELCAGHNIKSDARLTVVGSPA